ncbi:MAG: pyruvate kinase [Ruminococcaceae bacterium]|nr:pyruvate kinase [Oscillospiraceae bacterium]
MNNFRKTKIVCTMGPASLREDVLEDMLRSGMNIARFNFSHGTHEYHKEGMELFRKVRDRLKMPAAILLDTKGPEIRIGSFKDGCVELKNGQSFTLTACDVEGDSDKVSVTYKKLPAELHAGSKILVDDGRIELKVERICDNDIVCKVITGGELSGKKGINLPGVHIKMPYISEQDEKDLRFGIEMDIDFVAASFVRSKNDVIELRKLLNYYGGHSIKIIAKIENSEGVENFEEILANCDGIMVARGDMGVEIEYEKLPGLQKKFIRKCFSAGKMVITATQMLETMIHSKTPTRAEITDVANAVFDGTSAVMLSGETAMGDHPAHVVRVMSKIAERAEQDAIDMNVYAGISHEDDFSDLTNAICDAACTTARDVRAQAIIAVTTSGTTARRVSKFRPSQAIVAATPDVKTFHQLSMSWGVFPVLALNQDDTDRLFLHAIDCARQLDIVSKGDKVVITAGVPLKQSGTTNLLKVQEV